MPTKPELVAEWRAAYPDSKANPNRKTKAELEFELLSGQMTRKMARDEVWEKTCPSCDRETERWKKEHPEYEFLRGRKTHIPDEYDVCDSCLASELKVAYKLEESSVGCCCCGYGDDVTYTQESVLRAIRWMKGQTVVEP